MDLKILQQEVVKRGKVMKIKNQTSTEIMLGILEEAGEVAKEVALFEGVGNKINWKRSPSKELLGEEISQLVVNIVSLSSYYDIDLSKAMGNLLKD